jgi:hypothetical protein
MHRGRDERPFTSTIALTFVTCGSKIVLGLSSSAFLPQTVPSRDLVSLFCFLGS